VSVGASGPAEQLPASDRVTMPFPVPFVRGNRLRRALVVAISIISIAGPTIAAENAGSDTHFACLIQPKMVLKLGTPIPGLIKEVLVDRGAVVKKGDVVARLDSSVEEAAVNLAKARAADTSAVVSAQAKLDFQRRKEQRADQLKRSQNIAIATADEAESGARVAEADLRQAEANLQIAKLDLARTIEVLNQRTIRSPIDGIVIERTLGPGEYAFDQSHLITVSQINPLNVEVYVPLSQYGKITVGLKGEVYPESPVGGKYPATVTVVDQVFDAASATIGVRLELPNPDYTLPAGLKCDVRFPGIG